MNDPNAIYGSVFPDEKTVPLSELNEGMSTVSVKGMVFSNKSIDIKEGRSIIIASHNMDTLEDVCDRVMWIDEGKVREIGDPASVCYHFRSDMLDSFDTIIKMADEGDLPSMNRAAVMLRDGNGVERDEARAVDLFTRAAEMGYTESRMELADMKMKSGAKEEAIELYKKAAEEGSVDAVTRLTVMDGVNAEIAEKLKSEIRKEAESGNVRAMRLLADMLNTGNVFIKDRYEGFSWNMKCAKLGSATAQFLVAGCYRDGIGVEKNGEEAVRWYTEASRHGSARSRLELANMYRRGISVERDINKAIDWYKTAAEYGDANSMLQLGQIYRDGLGIDKDPVQAEFWLKRYAKQAMLGSEVTFAEILKQGHFGARQKDALFWYEDAAMNGNLTARISMGTAYRDGVLVPADSAKAAEWYSLAASMMSNMGNYELAIFQLKGNGIPRDTEEGVKTMALAADLGNANAILYMAMLYRDGILVEKNIPEAKRLLENLSEQGNVQARSMLLLIDE
ncbi:MAG: SEL1-like repeat protein [Candidatus Methanomethylophilaceae archaeon]|nr:SEL1-like repeat protein [Candidatus Methanomethylophilaceae archaeon]